MLVVHASDLHLGRPLRGLAHHPNLDRARFEHAGERALARLVELCLARKPSLLLIAGDLIDHWLRDYQLGLRLVRELSRLEYTGTRVFWVRGNHDAENRVISALLLPEHVSELGLGAVERRLLDSLGVALVGRSYDKRATEDNLFADFPEPIPALVNIGLLHTSADGASTGDRYAPCGRRQLVSSGYQYLGLGHVHEPQILSEKGTVITYSGCLQGRNFTESGPRGCRLVEFDGGRVTRLEHESLEVVRFGRIEIDVENAGTLEDVLRRVSERCGEAVAQHSALGLVVRISVKGRSGLECLNQCSTALRSQALRSTAETVSERLSIDGFWAHPPFEGAPSYRLDDERSVRRVDI